MIVARAKTTKSKDKERMMNMKRMIFRAALLFGAATMLLFTGCINPIGTGASGDISRHNTKDVNNGFFYQIWDNDKGSPTLTYANQAAGRYTLTWKGTDSSWNFVCGKGWKPSSTTRVVQYTGTFAPNKNSSGSDYQNCLLDFYGWANNNGLEYYVLESYGEYNVSKDSSYSKLGGTYTSNGATYQAYYTRKTGQPTPAGTGDFDQIYSIRTSRVTPGGSVSGKIIFADHVKVWSDNGHPVSLASTDWQIMATEGYGSVSGSSDITVSEGTAGPTGDMSTLANSVFRGDSSTANTGDTRGYWAANVAKTNANMTVSYTALPIELQFGNINGSKIDLTVLITLAALVPNPSDGTSYTRYIQVIGFIGQATIDTTAKTITATPLWKNSGTASETSDESSWLQQFTATLNDNNTLSFNYDFHKWFGMPASSNAYGDYGIAARTGAQKGASNPLLLGASAPTTPVDRAALLAAITPPKNLPVTAIPKIGSGMANLTVTSNWSAYSVESGQNNGVVQLQFTNPASPAKVQIELIVIDPVTNQAVFDFRATDSNPNYWGWGGEIKFPQAQKRYTIVIRKVAANPVSFSLRAW
jgi:endo-1,4-beta-xylanase